MPLGVDCLEAVLRESRQCPHMRVLVGLLGLGVVEERRELSEQAFVIAADDEEW